MTDDMTMTVGIRELMIAESRDLDGAITRMDEEEFRLFYERTSRPLWAYLSRITGDRHKADDFLQEAYYRFYRAGAQHESESHRRNSLFQIATNVVRDSARRGKRYSEVPLEVETSSSMASPEHETAMRSDVTRALSKLDAAQRQLLWLAYAQGASHHEIAEVLGIRSISVRTLLLRARRRLAAIMTRGSR